MSFIQSKLIELLWTKRIPVLKKLIIYSQQLKSRPLIILWWVLNFNHETQRRDIFSSLENFWVLLGSDGFSFSHGSGAKWKANLFHLCVLERFFFLCVLGSIWKEMVKLSSFSVMLETCICSVSWEGLHPYLEGLMKMAECCWVASGCPCGKLRLLSSRSAVVCLMGSSWPQSLNSFNNIRPHLCHVSI